VEAVGVDRDGSAFATGQKLAAERHLSTVRFVQADLLADDFPLLGQFDTVTALHVLDHIPEEQTARALTHLLSVTRHRLIVAVPYAAGAPEAAGGHQQWFSREKLEEMGHWCLQQMQGAGRMWCEDLIGGLLLVERTR
jgi:ubiquinone/menaquinone biosynthesis C-methylase UbiE